MSEPKEPVPAVDPIHRIDKARPLAPALHIAPAAHAHAPLDSAAMAAVNAARARDTVEHVEGVKPVGAVARSHSADAPQHIALTQTGTAHLTQETWNVVQKLSHVRADEVGALLLEHPEAAHQLAELFVHSGGATALGRQAHDTPAPAAGPQPDKPHDESHAGVSLNHGGPPKR